MELKSYWQPLTRAVRPIEQGCIFESILYSADQNLDGMRRIIETYHMTVVSDVIRDGLGVELWDNCYHMVAEVFRCDADKTVILRTFDHDVPLHVIEIFIKFSRERLEPFEDGSSLQ